MPISKTPDGRPSSVNTAAASDVDGRSASFDDGMAAHLFDVSPLPAVVSRLADHTVLAINSRTAEMFGVSPSDALGLKVTDYYVDASNRQTLIDQLRREGRADNLRVQLRRPNGDRFWVQSSVRL